VAPGREQHPQPIGRERVFSGPGPGDRGELRGQPECGGVAGVDQPPPVEDPLAVEADGVVTLGAPSGVAPGRFRQPPPMTSPSRRTPTRPRVGELTWTCPNGGGGSWPPRCEWPGSRRLLQRGWWTWPGSNRRPRECHSRALPTALQAHRREGKITSRRRRRSTTGGTSRGLPPLSRRGASSLRVRRDASPAGEEQECPWLPGRSTWLRRREGGNWHLLTECPFSEKTHLAMIDLTQYDGVEVRFDPESLTANPSHGQVPPARRQGPHALEELGIEAGRPALEALAGDPARLDFVVRPEAFPRLWERLTRGS
jgi:hypothetical protein